MPATSRTVANYLSDVARVRRPSTVRRRLAAIQSHHVSRGERSPVDSNVRVVSAGAEWRGRRLRRPTQPLHAAELLRCSVALPDSVAGRRDRAVLLVAYGAALRRTELVALDATDMRISRNGSLLVRVARGTVQIPPGSTELICAVRAWSEWKRAAGPHLRRGAAFRPIDRHGNISRTRLSDRAVTTIVQRAAARAGLPRPERFTGRSLRLGMILAAAAVGTPDEGIMAHTGHRSKRLVRDYRRAR